MKAWKSTSLREVNIMYATKEEGIALITERDEYVSNLTPFDIQIRLQREGTIEDYLDTCRSSVLDFSDSEIDLLREIFWEIGSEIERHGMTIPYIETINVVKTTLKEESNMGAYTRGNTIYLGETVFCLNEGDIEHVVCHELFHILSRCSNEFKKDVYKAINFVVKDKSFDLNKFSNIRFVSNPDVSLQCCYIVMESPDRKRVPYYMTTIAPKDSNCYDLQSSIHPYFIPLDKNLDIKTDVNGDPLLIPLKKMSLQFLKYVGRNTEYIINPEEILAENFCLAVLGSIYDIPSPQVIKALRHFTKAS